MRFNIRLERCGGLDKIESLQTHPDDAVYEKAYNLLTTYFEVETVEDLRLEIDGDEVLILADQFEYASLGKHRHVIPSLFDE